ncbi:MAG: DUF4402 domain-containing protein [Chitinophagaceae bacterium]|nr:MAG: DUF4402 domain-containing protein [Chitinophagaceae bacterium]
MYRIHFSYRQCLLLVLLSGCFLQAKSQQLGLAISTSSPALRVQVRQELQFGAFTQGTAGGTVEILPEGSRMATGTVVPLNFSANVTSLILEVEGPKGAIVSMLAGEVSVLTGSNGGIMKLRLKQSHPLMPFIIMEEAPARTIINIGAELIVGNLQESPPGNYSGSLNISFIVE